MKSKKKFITLKTGPAKIDASLNAGSIYEYIGNIEQRIILLPWIIIIYTKNNDKSTAFCNTQDR